MKNLFKNLYLSNRFFLLLGGLCLLFLLGFAIPLLFPVALALFVLSIALIATDIFRLFKKSTRVDAKRVLPKVLSLSDANDIHIDLFNYTEAAYQIQIIDELPVQLQIRDFGKNTTLAAKEQKRITYELRPLERGEYSFGDINLYLSTALNLVERRIRVAQEADVAVYPSIIQMKQMELQAFDRISYQQGIKKMRRIGHSYEFDHIKNYVR
ncbi:MAG: DUF58 domain-containing protein, partial [Bacteroidota bacterium]